MRRLPGVNYPDLRVASRRNVTRRAVVVGPRFFVSFLSFVVEGCGHVGEGCGGGQRSRQRRVVHRRSRRVFRRIVHMSIAPRGSIFLDLRLSRFGRHGGGLAQAAQD